MVFLKENKDDIKSNYQSINSLKWKNTLCNRD